MSEPWHQGRPVPQPGAEVFPKPGSIWRPWHKKPHRNNNGIKIRQFILSAKEKEKEKDNESIKHK